MQLAVAASGVLVSGGAAHRRADPGQGSVRPLVGPAFRLHDVATLLDYRSISDGTPVYLDEETLLPPVLPE
ncbi:hypothetical protein [Streptomyces sp. BRA346]|uniref:hypothetical protein n=1 Tax=Streptomyces sp. BRA346 TaxID=2878199 RepID=UPI004062ABF3